MAGALAERVVFDLGPNVYVQARVPMLADYAQTRVPALAGPRVAAKAWAEAPAVDVDARIEVAVSRAVRQTVTRAVALFISFAAFALLGLAAGSMLPPLLDSGAARSTPPRVEEAVPNAAQVQPLFVVTASDAPRPAGAVAKQPAQTKPVAIDTILEDAL
jgi:hypothetical protein